MLTPTLTFRLTPTLLPAPNGPLPGLEAAPDGADYYCSAVLVPGHEPKEVFVPLMGLLARDGHRVLTLDHRARHEPTSVEALPALARDLEVALTAAAARHPVHLLGHGFGAVLAAQVVISAPDKCRTFTTIGALDSTPDSTPASAIAASGVPTLVIDATDAGDLATPDTLAERILTHWQRHHARLRTSG